MDPNSKESEGVEGKSRNVKMTVKKTKGDVLFELFEIKKGKILVKKMCFEEKSQKEFDKDS